MRKKIATHIKRRKEGLSSISLFSGAMGLDIGLELAGFQTVMALEVNPNAVQTIKLNKPALPVILEKIENVSKQKILRESQLKVGEACLVTGGPCCQAFSTAGKRKSLADSRGGLFSHFKRVVKETRPRFFIMENVKGILSAAVKHRPLKQRGPGNPPLSLDEELGSALRVIRKELEDLQYYVIFGLLNCADYGTPQSRYRVVFIGSRDGEDISLPKATHADNSSNGQHRRITLRKSIGRIKEKNPEYIEFSTSQKHYLRQLKSGENWRNLPKQVQKKALGAAYNSWGGRSGFYRRLAWDKPAPTLTTVPTAKATALCHPEALRPLSIKEYKALQQFPVSWKLSGSTTEKYIQIGNAVPIGLGRSIGVMLRQVMRKTKRNGLPRDAKHRKGTVVCADLELEKRLADQPRTKLEPPSFRLDPSPEAAREWLQSVA